MPPDPSDLDAQPARRRKRVDADRLLDAACAEFARAGFEQAGMRAIARRARTTPATLYARFGSKEDLFVATLQRESKLLREGLFRAYAQAPAADPQSRLAAYVDAYFDFGLQRPDGLRLLVMETGARGSEIAAEMRDEIAARIGELLARERGHREIDDTDRILAALIIGATHYGAGAAVATGVDIAHAARLTSRFLARGLTR